MFYRSILILLCFTVCAAAHAEILGGNINFLLGQRTMMDSDWDDFEVKDQLLYGINVDLQLPVLPGIEFGLLRSSEDGNFASQDTELVMTDIFVGLNKTISLPGSPLHPFIGGGLTVRTAEVDIDAIIDDDDNDIGLYIHGGVFWRIGTGFNIGVDARIIVGDDVDFGGGEANVNSYVASLILGYGF